MVAELFQMVFHNAEQLTLEHVEHARHDDAYGRGMLADHIAGGTIGDIAGLLDCRKDTLALVSLDVILMVEHPGDGGNRDPCQFRYVLDTYHIHIPMLRTLSQMHHATCAIALSNGFTQAKFLYKYVRCCILKETGNVFIK